MEDRLKYLLDKANHWVSYSEAKNASIVVLGCAVMRGAMDKCPGATANWIVAWNFWLGFSCLVFAALVALLSFFPIRIFDWIEVSWWKEAAEEPSPATNLFFFEHVARLAPCRFLEALYESEGGEQKNPNRKLELDLAGQIVINSRIASRKFSFFQISLGAVLLGIAFFVIAGGASILWRVV